MSEPGVLHNTLKPSFNIFSYSLPQVRECVQKEVTELNAPTVRALNELNRAIYSVRAY